MGEHMRAYKELGFSMTMNYISINSNFESFARCKIQN